MSDSFAFLLLYCSGSKASSSSASLVALLPRYVYEFFFNVKQKHWFWTMGYKVVGILMDQQVYSSAVSFWRLPCAPWEFEYLPANFIQFMIYGFCLCRG